MKLSNLCAIGVFAGCFLIYACKKPIDPPPPASIDNRDKFTGKYEVLSDSGYKYNMEITKFDSANIKWLRFTNFSNRFPVVLSNYNGNYTPDNFLMVDGGFGIKDYAGNRWDLGGGYDDSSTVEKENLLINNKINIYFRLQNAPWWGADGIPYHFAFHKHTATKF